MALDVDYLLDEIEAQYLEDDRPWIVGFSGGKDSTMLLQLVWTAIRRINPENRQKKIYVICNNTLVENPKVLEYVEDVLNKIRRAAVLQTMPMIVDQTTPTLEDSFWVNLIGKGYPAPSSLMRWCTERLKIRPTTKYILDKVSTLGEVVILLGSRSDESSTRAKSLAKYAQKGTRLRKHILPNAYVFAPIKDVLTEEVWQYLNNVDSPWGAFNKTLTTLYKNASGGDCPLVTDLETPSCGQSRFGCWVCTVVKKDKSMEGLILNGESWMEPLMDIRDFLLEARDNHDKYRMKVRRNKDEGIGPYLPEVRKQILESILRAQKEAQAESPGIELISHQELVAIQVTWYRDGYFDLNVAEIYNSVYDKYISLENADESWIKEQNLLKDACGGDGRQYKLLNELLLLQKTKTLLVKQRGLQNDLENQLEKYISI